MEPLYDVTAPKKNTTVTLNSDLLRQARALGVNLSGALEALLAELIAADRRARWLAENREAIDLYNERIERRGVFSDGLRRF